VIRRLIERDCVGACVGPVWDPVAVAFCHAAGMGTTFSLRFGGKAAATSGDPIDAEVTVIGLCRNGQQSFGSAKKSFGDAAGIRVGGVEVSLIAARTQALGTEIFSEVGIDIASKCYIGVKSTNHFYAAFRPIAAKVLYCDGKGPSPVDPREYPFRKIIRPSGHMMSYRMVVWWCDHLWFAQRHAAARLKARKKAERTAAANPRLAPLSGPKADLSPPPYFSRF
jgi:microcystin degradation protein MlrC